MKRIISFSLWGNVPKYTIGAIRNAELAHSIYPGWTARFYVGSSTSRSIIESLQNFGAEVILMEESGDWSSTFWRFLPAGEADVEVMLSRDTDSRLSLREKVAVDAWLSTDASFHIMRDHPEHNAEILAGMWGVRGGVLHDMRVLIDAYPKDNIYFVDQRFLRDVIYPRIKNISVVHDDFFERTGFPIERANHEFVGDVFDENDVRHPEYWKVFL